MREYFYQLADFLQRRLGTGEEYSAWLAAEESDFVRFNHGRVRQAGSVSQIRLDLRLLHGGRQVGASLNLSGEAGADADRLGAELAALRALLGEVALDPHLLLNEAPERHEHIDPPRLPPTAAIVEEVVSAAHGQDLVGLLASGPVYHGYASSLGQRYWHQSSSFNLDWSLYADGDKAVKDNYSGTAWSACEFHTKLARGGAELALLRRPARSIAPGGYRAYLAPAAMEELVGMLAGAFSAKALRSRRSPLQQLADRSRTLHPAVSFSEDPAAGLAPTFQGDGFRFAGPVPLVTEGRLAGELIAPRSAVEYGLQPNGTAEGEYCRSLVMAPGSLATECALAELDRGLYVSNLWYLNYADRSTARLTGMTRFACFWVEGGELVAPLNVMRFDDSVYRMLGSELLALTREREFMAETMTYGSRHTASMLLPGALLGDLRLVL